MCLLLLWCVFFWRKWHNWVKRSIDRTKQMYVLIIHLLELFFHCLSRNGYTLNQLNNIEFKILHRRIALLISSYDWWFYLQWIWVWSRVEPTKWLLLIVFFLSPAFHWNICCTRWNHQSVLIMIFGFLISFFPFQNSNFVIHPLPSQALCKIWRLKREFDH